MDVLGEFSPQVLSLVAPPADETIVSLLQRAVRAQLRLEHASRYHEWTI